MDGPKKAALQCPNRGANEFKEDAISCKPTAGSIQGKFDYIVLFCPTFVKNKTYDRYVDKDSRIFVVVCMQHKIEG